MATPAPRALCGAGSFLESRMPAPHRLLPILLLARFECIWRKCDPRRALHRPNIRRC